MLERLKQYRDEILKAEIASLFALWEQKVLGLNNKKNLKLNIETLFDIPVYILSKEFNLYKDFLKDWRNKWDNELKKFYNVCEITNSQYEKINIKSTKINTLSNPFGTIITNSNKNNNNSNNEIESSITNFLDLSNKNNQQEQIYESYVKLKDNLKNIYVKLLSDDRFPNNEVSLWEQSYMTSSLFKALLSNYILTEKEIKNVKDIKWRILGVQYDKVGVAEKSLKLASIAWYREITKMIDEEIKRLLEVEYPIGNEIYRDETGIYFIVGKDIGEDLNDGSNLAKLKEDLNKIEDKILKKFKDLTNDEFYPAIFLTKSSRGLMNLSTLLEKAKENFLKANWKKKNSKLKLEDDNKGKAIGICPVCQVRLIYEKDKEKKNQPTICEVCDNRIHHKQVEKWIKNKDKNEDKNKDKETIWIDEVKDKNNRVAYVSLKFELEDWLNGNLLNSLLEINERDMNHLVKKIKDKIYNKDNRIDEQWLHLSLRRNENYKKVGEQSAENIFFDNIVGTKWEDWIKTTPLNHKIDWYKEKIKWEEFNDLNDPALDLLSNLLLQFLLRKNPSPARLRRIWETTREFFKEIHYELDNILKIPEWMKKRLVWEVNLDENNKLEKSMELEAEGLLFWAEKEGNKAKIYLISSISDFLEKFGNIRVKKTLENLKESNIIEEILQENDTFERNNNIQNKKITLYPYGNKNDDKNKIELYVKDNISEIHPYKPYTSIIDPSPINYQVVIPAEYLPKLIDKVIEKYNEELKYVYGKLPIHIGIVISDYKKPVYINLKALRRIRRDVKDINKLYKNVSIGKFCILQKQKLSFANKNEKINNTEDYYSLYWNNLEEKDYNFFIKPRNEWKKWISTTDKFGPKSKVQIIPNTFDFELLDHNIRRNEIFYDENGKRLISLKQNRPYEIEVYWEKFKKFKELFDKTDLNTTRIHKLIELLYSKLQVEKEYNSDYSYLLTSAFIELLELNRIGKNYAQRRKIINDIFELEINNFVELSNDFKKNLQKSLTKKENILLFLDMFEFWHTAMKEV